MIKMNTRRAIVAGLVLVVLTAVVLAGRRRYHRVQNQKREAIRAKAKELYLIGGPPPSSLHDLTQRVATAQSMTNEAR